MLVNHWFILYTLIDSLTLHLPGNRFSLAISFVGWFVCNIIVGFSGYNADANIVNIWPMYIHKLNMNSWIFDMAASKYYKSKYYLVQKKSNNPMKRWNSSWNRFKYTVDTDKGMESSRINIRLEKLKRNCNK